MIQHRMSNYDEKPNMTYQSKNRNRSIVIILSCHNILTFGSVWCVFQNSSWIIGQVHIVNFETAL